MQRESGMVVVVSADIVRWGADTEQASRGVMSSVYVCVNREPSRVVRELSWASSRHLRAHRRRVSVA
jgi:hypothetical protein